MPMRFEDKTAVITGGANGIGRASAMRFAQGGARVVILDIEEDRALEVVEDIRATTGATATSYALDLTVGEQIRDTFHEIATDVGPVDVLLNNVGQTARENATEFWLSKPETWNFVINVSLMSVLHATHQVVPQMRERGSGKIVCIASDSAIIGDAGIADYAAAKAGVMGFVRSLARELAPFKINVNAVCPGMTRTRGPLKLPKEVYEASLNGIPWREACEPEDIAASVAFLASEDARYITGQALVVNGGRVFY